MRAAWCPKFLDRLTDTTRPSRSAASSNSRRVPSELPSSTSTISWGPPGRPSRTLPTLRSSSGSVSSSLKSGTATEIRGSLTGRFP